MTEKEKMLAGELYDPLDSELTQARDRARDLCRDLNATRAMDKEDRAYALNLIGVRIGKEHVFEKLRIQRGIPLLARETLLGRMTL